MNERIISEETLRQCATHIVGSVRGFTKAQGRDQEALKQPGLSNEEIRRLEFSIQWTDHKIKELSKLSDELFAILEDRTTSRFNKHYIAWAEVNRHRIRAQNQTPKDFMEAHIIIMDDMNGYGSLPSDHPDFQVLLEEVYDEVNWGAVVAVIWPEVMQNEAYLDLGTHFQELNA